MNQDLNDFNMRFGGIARLYGTKALLRLKNSNILVVGLGGVGSWACEALIRSGVGHLTLVDLDEVCITNTNRQLCALQSTIGQSKAQVLKKRLQDINPDANILLIENFFTENTFEEILSQPYDYVLDAIDSRENKCLLISEASKRNLPIITTGGAAGKIDPTQIKIDDLAFSTNDVLLQIVRKKLRRDYNFTKVLGRTLNSRRKLGITCVYSPEEPRFPTTTGDICHIPDPETNLKLDCESGMGSSTFITGTFGFYAASHIIKELAEKSE
jgi:tRNA A37 threonylcarbamoyladenosine dehydratase